MQAYNDWHIDEWCGSHPGRFIPMAIPAIWDPQLCADEIRRVSKKGVHSLTFTENPSALGYPSFHDLDYWKPMWDALVDTETVMNVHIGSSGRLAITAPDAPMDVMITLQPMNIVQAAADLLWSAPIKAYPDLKIALSEGGTGWIPYFLDRVDRTYEMHSTWTHQDFGDKLPSEVFREHFMTCFISDPVGVKNRHMIGVDNICWEMDYPHSDSMWPGAPEELDAVFKTYDVPDDEINKITHENAMRLYHFDPFKHVPREEAKVGALRKQAEGHDVSIQALSNHDKRGGSSFADFTANARGQRRQRLARARIGGRCRRRLHRAVACTEFRRNRVRGNELRTHRRSAADPEIGGRTGIQVRRPLLDGKGPGARVPAGVLRCDRRRRLAGHDHPRGVRRARSGYHRGHHPGRGGGPFRRSHECRQLHPHVDLRYAAGGGVRL